MAHTTNTTEMQRSTISDRFSNLYAAFNARDIDAVLAAMALDVDWANGTEGGRGHGTEAVREYWTRQWEIIDPHVDPVRVTEEDAGRIVVDVHQVVRDLAGTVIANQVVQHVYHLRDGRIVRMDIHSTGD